MIRTARTASTSTPPTAAWLNKTPAAIPVPLLFGGRSSNRGFCTPLLVSAPRFLPFNIDHFSLIVGRDAGEDETTRMRFVDRVLDCQRDASLMLDLITCTVEAHDQKEFCEILETLSASLPADPTQMMAQPEYEASHSHSQESIFNMTGFE